MLARGSRAGVVAGLDLEPVEQAFSEARRETAKAERRNAALFITQVEGVYPPLPVSRRVSRTDAPAGTVRRELT